MRLRFYSRFWEIGRVTIFWSWDMVLWGVSRGLNDWTIHAWPADINFRAGHDARWNSLIVDRGLFRIRSWRIRLQVDLYLWVVGFYFGRDDNGVQLGPVGLSLENYPFDDGWHSASPAARTSGPVSNQG